MGRKLKLMFSLSAALCAAVSLAQAAPKGSVTYVYVSTPAASTGRNEVHAWATSATGKLTPIAGTPFQENVTSMAVNGRFLYGATRTGTDVNSYRMEANGALRYAVTTNITRYNATDCASAGAVFTDRTGDTVYNLEYRGDGCANNAYRSFREESATGGLQNLGESGGNSWLYQPASFLGNNTWAYSASCLGNMYWGIFGFRRSSNGKLTEVPISAPVPAPPNGEFFCPSQAAADGTNHVAIAMQAVKQQDFSAVGEPHVAVYTAQGNGNLTTTSTVANMPQANVGTVSDMKTSADGKWLAVAGSRGLEIFHFNGASPLTHLKGLLTSDAIDQCFWDKAGHLYAISGKAGKLFVFAVTPDGAHAAPDSPYNVTKPEYLAVWSK
jgi:6-phosphogluconolactonase (cycloisomerase 2 family)